MTVELYNPERVYSAPAGARLTYRGGPLLQKAELFGVFIDDPATGNPYPLTAELSAFLDWYGTSDLIKELDEYTISGPASHVGDARLSLGSTPPPPPPGDCSAELDALLSCLGYATPVKKKKHGHGSLELPHRIVPLAGTVVQDSDLQNLLTSSINAGALPAPTASMVYIMFLPAGVTVQIGQDVSCQTFCGYHSNFTLSTGAAVYYAVLPYPSCAGCMGSLSSPLDSLTAITSHEISEAITDPIPGQGWYDDANGEIGDICAWQFRQDGQYNVQLEWSNLRNACI